MSGSALRSHPLFQAPDPARNSAAHGVLQGQIEATGRQACPDAGRIDQLVYELYGLTEEEIRIVEEATER